MKSRHAAVLALIGWYLMLPPLGSGSDVYDKGALLSKWRQTSTFDSAEDCQRHRDLYIDMYTKRESYDPDAVPNLKLYSAGICVSDDDKRLNPK